MLRGVGRVRNLRGSLLRHSLFRQRLVLFVVLYACSLPWHHGLLISRSKRFYPPECATNRGSRACANKGNPLGDGNDLRFERPIPRPSPQTDVRLLPSTP